MRSRHVKTALYYLLASALAFIFLLPFLIMLFGSFDGEQKYAISLTNWIPKTWSLRAYVNVLTIGSDVLRWLLNSMITSFIPMCTSLFICPLLGYIFAKKDFRGKNIVFWYFMVAIMIPSQATIVSSYLVYNSFGWINTYWVLLIPGMWTVVYMFMMRNYIVSLPDALLEAAKIDGAGEWCVFLKIVMPLCKTALSTVALFTFMNSWNNFMGPLVMTSSSDMYTLTVGLATLNGKTGSFNMQMTASVITVLPIFIVYLFLQRYFIEGIVTGGVKG